MKRWMIVIGLILSMGSVAQDPAEVESIALELIENGQPDEAEELFATFRKHLDQPVDLNHCTREELAATGLFSPFQAFAITDQRKRYGPFLSIYELAAIPGIDRDLLEEVRGMVTFAFEATPELPRGVDGLLLTNIAVRLPRTSGMLQTSSDDAVYAGNLFKCTQRTSLNYGNKISMGVAYEKDAGEPWANRNRPEHLTGYLTWAPGNTIRKLVIGNYRIHRGMGLVHKLGFSSRGTGHPLNGYTRSYGKPFASTLEYDYFRGIYGEASSGKWELDLFLSHQPADISFHRLREKHDLFEMTRRTGLHRTRNERDGFDLARISAAGASINRSGEHFYAGWSISGGEMHLTQVGLDSTGGTDPAKAWRAATSLYGVLFGSSYEMYGEFAMDHTFHGAFLFGGTWIINPALSAEASLKRIAPGFRGIMPGPVNEEENTYDLQLGCRLTPFRHARFRLYHELQLAAPGASLNGLPAPERYSIFEFLYQKGNGPELKLKYTGKSMQELLAGNQPGNGWFQERSSAHFRIHLKWEHSEKLILQGRLEISSLRKNANDERSKQNNTTRLSGRHRINAVDGIFGSMAYQQVQVILRNDIRITYRFLLFNVPDWESRIYTYEPGVRYSFLFPSWYGTGSRNVLVGAVKMGQHITLRGKCGLTQYAHRWDSGSGNDRRNGSRLLDAELQLQVKLY